MSAPHYFFSFFPQFHSDPINDRAWGAGFTDWDLIRAMPEEVRDRFTPERGYYNPSHDGYVSSLCAQLNELQLENAGLMVYHYYFDGVSALSGFEGQLLAQPQIGLPFFLCWANETWSKRWIGKPGEILIEQQHKLDSDLIREHAAYLVQFFNLPHYHRVAGRPLFMIYNAQATLTLPKVLELYRKEFLALGHDPMIGACVAYPQPSEQLELYDFGCEFEPRFFFNRNMTMPALTKLAMYLKTSLPHFFEWLGNQRDRFRQLSNGRIFSYAEYLSAIRDGSLEKLLRTSIGQRPLMRAIFLSWDNSPRYRERSTSMDYAGVTSASLDVLKTLRSDAGLPILINSWNEWSEGAALEKARGAQAFREDFLRSIDNLRDSKLSR